MSKQERDRVTSELLEDHLVTSTSSPETNSSLQHASAPAGKAFEDTLTLLRTSYTRSLLFVLIIALTIFSIIGVSDLHYRIVKILAGLGALLIAYLIIIAMTERMSKPIIILREQAKALTEDIHSLQEFKVEKAPKEIAELSDCLNALSKKLISAAQEAQKNEELQKRFVSDVSHELKTPLTAIKGTAELILDDPQMPQEIRERFLSSIVKESNRLNRLAKDLLELNVVENKKLRLDLLESLNLENLAYEAAHLLQTQAESKDVSIQIEGSCKSIAGEEPMLLRVFINLIDNALRYAPEHSCIKIRLSQPSDHISCVSIKDEGAGFKTSDTSLLFKRFYQENPSRKREYDEDLSGGSGLGLSIVHSIIRAHHANITAYNHPDGGACFKMCFRSSD